MMDDSKVDDQKGSIAIPDDDKFVRTVRRMLSSPPSPAGKKESPERGSENKGKSKVSSSVGLSGRG